jgi:ribosomal protein S18 acetylase RimI-like enzyme
MIRRALLRDEDKLRILYAGSIYGGLPALVEWALREVAERVVVFEEGGEILAAAYIDGGGYDNLWVSYLAFKDKGAVNRLVDYLLEVRRKEGFRNVYVFCPKEFVDVRVHLILRGFVPECVRRLDGIDYVVKRYDGSFNPNYQVPKQRKQLFVNVRQGKAHEVEALSRILHESLPRDFDSVEDAVKCVKRWVAQMPEYLLVAEHEDKPAGVLLLSREISPVLDKNLGMLCFIAVDERFRRMGVGRALVKEACNVLRGKGKSSMEVDVSVGNIQARVFYTKLGFYPFWFSKGYMPHDDGIFYRLDF